MDTAIRTTRSASEADEWTLVLAASGISHRVAPDGDGWTVFVCEADARQAQAALDGYVEEAAQRSRDSSQDAPAHRGWAVGIAVAALLAAWFAVTGPPAPGSRWFAQGAASARHIVGGEPWRAITALTLHVDGFHVAGNALASAVLVTAVVQRLGPGVGLWAVLLAGAIGNVLAALAHTPGHVAVGASTATFGAIAVLVTLRLSAAPGATGFTGRRSIVLAAGVVLLAMLGAGPRADVLSHALGFAAGGAIGLAAGVGRPPGPFAQWSLVALAGLAVVGAWRLALAR